MNHETLIPFIQPLSSPEGDSGLVEGLRTWDQGLQGSNAAQTVGFSEQKNPLMFDPPHQVYKWVPW